MNFAHLLEMAGKRLDSYQVRQTYDHCQMTVDVLATYHCIACNQNEQWNFKFYYWRMPTHQYGVYNVRLSSFEKCSVSGAILKLDADYHISIN